MAKPSAKRRQKARRRKKSKRKEKRSLLSRVFQSPRTLLRSSGSWPLHECLLTKGWQKEGTIVQILVARRSPTGQIATGTFLVDLGCLGVKSAFASLFDTRREYQRKLRAGMMAQQKMIKTDLNLVAKIIRDAIAYAKELGCKPDPDAPDAMLVPGEAHADPRAAAQCPPPWASETASPSSSPAPTTTWTASWPS